MDTRTQITQFDECGNIVAITYGFTQTQLLEHHNDGRCDMWCNYCYQEAIEYKKQNP